MARLAQRRLAYGERRGEGRERGSLRVDAGDARGDADAENLGGVQLGRRIQTAHLMRHRSIFKVPSFTERSHTPRSVRAVGAGDALKGPARLVLGTPCARGIEARAFVRGRAGHASRRLSICPSSRAQNLGVTAI